MVCQQNSPTEQGIIKHLNTMHPRAGQRDPKHSYMKFTPEIDENACLFFLTPKKIFNSDSEVDAESTQAINTEDNPGEYVARGYVD